MTRTPPPQTEIAPSELAQQCLESRLSKVRTSLEGLAANWPPDPEAVHQLRVGTRRATAALRLFRDLLAKKDYRWWKKRLKTWRRAAGEVRNNDILIEFLESWNGGALSGHEDLEPVIRVVRVQQAFARIELRKIVEQLDFSRLKQRQKKLLRHLTSPNPLPPDAQRAEWASRQIQPVYQRFTQAIPEVESNEAALHQFRIAGKRLRYTLELLADAWPRSEWKQVLKTIGQLQDRLGKLNDLTTLDQLLSRLFLLDEAEVGPVDPECCPSEPHPGRPAEPMQPPGIPSSRKPADGKATPDAAQATALAVIRDLQPSRQLERQQILHWWSREGSEICRLLEKSLP